MALLVPRGISRAVDLSAFSLGTSRTIQRLLLSLQLRPIYAFLIHGIDASKPYLYKEQLYTVYSLSKLAMVVNLA